MTQAQATATEQQPISDRNRWIALYVLCIGMLMIVLDITVVNVALPSIKDDLGFSQSSLAWVVNAYLITFGGLLLLAGRLGDLVGRRTIFLWGLAVFVAASLLCGASQSEGMLIGARLLQGIGGAMTSAVILGMIVTMFPEPREQAKAVGIYAFVASAGGAVGLLIGGILTQTISWHWIFFVNAPIGLVTALLARRLLEKDEGIGFGEGADSLGAVLITASLMLGVYTIVEPAAKDGWGAPLTLGLGAASLALLGAFIAREATTSNPLIPLRIFRSRNVSGANVVQVLTVAGMFGMFFMGSLYLQLVQGYDALQIGLAFLPVTIIMGTLTGSLLRAADHALRRTEAALPGSRAGDRRLGAVHAGSGRRQLLRRRPAGPDPAGRRDRHLLPRADDDRDVGCHQGRRRACLGPGQHLRSGRRRSRPCRPRDPLHLAQRQPRGCRTLDRLGADQRLSPGLLGRCGTGRGRDRVSSRS